MKNKNGFVSMAVVYSFILVFLVVLLSLLSAYQYRNTVINNQVIELKNELNKEIP